MFLAETVISHPDEDNDARFALIVDKTGDLFNLWVATDLFRTRWTTEVWMEECVQ